MAKGGQGEALGRCRGGPATKIYKACDAQGPPMRFALTGGQASDGPRAVPLRTGIEAGAVLAHKGYEGNRILAFNPSGGATAVMPPKANRKEPWEYDRELYRERNPIEWAINQMEHWRRIAARHERRSIHFLSGLYPVSWVVRG